MADTLLDALERTRVGYGAEMTWHKFLHDAYAGAGGFGHRLQPDSSPWSGFHTSYGEAEALSEVFSTEPGFNTRFKTYIRRFPRETDKGFLSRIQATDYTNFCRPITDIKTSYILSKTFLTQGLPSAIENWLGDVDGRGTSFSKIESNSLTKAATIGWVPHVVDLPPTPVGDDGRPVELTRAKAEELGIRATLTSLYPSNLVEWGCNDDGGFSWAKVRTDHCDRAGPFEDERVYSRYTIWYPDRFDLFEVAEENNKRHAKRITPEGGASHPFDEVPIAILRAASSEDGVKGTAMHQDVAKLCNSLFDRDSELTHHERDQMFAILVMACKDAESAKHALALGVNQGLLLDPESRNQHYFMAPPSEVSSSLEATMSRKGQDIYKVGRVEYENDSRERSSGLSRQYAFASTDRALADCAKHVADFRMKVVRLAARGMQVSVPEDFLITPPDTFDIEDLNEQLEQALAATAIGMGATVTDMIKVQAARKFVKGFDADMEKTMLDELQAEREEEAAFDASDKALDGAILAAE